MWKRIMIIYLLAHKVNLKKKWLCCKKKSYDGNCKFYFILQKYELMEALKCFIC